MNPLRWCYTGRFATTIFSATQGSNVGTIFSNSKQCNNSVVTLCCWCQIQIDILACVMSSEYFSENFSVFGQIENLWMSLHQIPGNWAGRNFITASRGVRLTWSWVKWPSDPYFLIISSFPRNSGYKLPTTSFVRSQPRKGQPFCVCPSCTSLFQAFSWRGRDQKKWWGRGREREWNSPILKPV